MKKIYKYMLLLIVMFVFSVDNVRGTFSDFTGGNEVNIGKLTGGEWNTYDVGIKVSIVSGSGEWKSSKIFVNRDITYSLYLNSPITPKTHDDNKIKWTEESTPGSVLNVTDILPPPQEDALQGVNLDYLLTKSNYTNLKKLLTKFDQLSSGDYILVEPMVRISVYNGTYYGTAYEFIRSFYNGDCSTEGSFCYTYSREVFEGNSNNVNGGVLMNTIFVEGTVSFGDKTITEYFDNPSVEFQDNRINRQAAFASSTGGLGIGVYRYDELYASIDIKKVDSTNTNKKIKDAGFTLYSDSTCSYKVQDEKETDANGTITFSKLDFNKTYYVKETTLPPGYVGTGKYTINNTTSTVPSNKCIPVKTPTSTSSSSKVIITITNEPQLNLGSLKIKKTMTDGTSSDGIEFSLHTDSSCGTTAVKKGSISNGILIFKELEIGKKYYLKENVPNDYTTSLNNNCEPIVITEANPDVIEVINEKEAAKGPIRVYVYDRDKNVRISNPNYYAEYTIHKGTNCTGDIAHDTKRTSTGYAFFRVDRGQVYSIKETVKLRSSTSTDIEYKPVITEECVVKNIDFPAGEPTVSVYVKYYIPGCNDKLNILIQEYGGRSKIPTNLLLDLYNEYPENDKLLQFKNPYCASKARPTVDLSLTCLSGTSVYSELEFSSNDLSNYEYVLSDEYENRIGFCRSTFLLTNNLNEFRFYGTAGQALINHDMSNNQIVYYNSNYEPVTIDGGVIATANVGTICYMVGDNSPILYSSVPNSYKSVNVLFGDNDFDDQADGMIRTIYNNPVDISTEGIFKKYVYGRTTYFSLKSNYYKDLTGNISFNSVGTRYGYSTRGILTKFNYYDAEQSGIIPNTIKYNDEEYNIDMCKYTVKKGIVEENDLQLEFRIIDTSVPFYNRNTGSNWCDETDCTPDNDLVKDKIINSNNSYNKTKAGYKYRIVLTSSDIETIRKYNKENFYDDYQTVVYEENGNSVTENAFIYALRNGVVRTYKENSINKTKKTYGSLSNSLIVN